MGLYANPGVGSTTSASAREVIWGANDNRAVIVRRSRIISSTAADAGNTPTTNLRSGLLMGNVTSSSEAEQWDPLATNGTKDITDVLETPFELRTTDLEGTARDSFYKTLVRAPLMASQLLIKGSAFVGHAYEYLARQQLHRAGFILNDDPMNGQRAQPSRQPPRKTEPRFSSRTRLPSRSLCQRSKLVCDIASSELLMKK